MKRYCLLFKFLAFLLACICFLTTLFCGYGIISLVEANLYQKYPDSLAKSWCYGTGQERAETAAQHYAATALGGCPKELVEMIYNGSGFYRGSYVQINQDGETVYAVGDVIEDGITIDYRLTIDYPMVVPQEDEDDPVEDDISDKTGEDNSSSILRPIQTYEVLIGGQRLTYEVYFTEVTLEATVTLDQSILNNTNYQLLSWLYPFRYAMIWGGVISVLAGIAMLVYLIWVAGRNKAGLVELIGLTRLPIDVYLVGSATVLFLFLQLFYAIVDTVYSFHLLILAILGITLTIPLLLGFLYILAAQSKCKGGYWWRHSLLGRFIRFSVKGIGALLNMLPAVWQWLVISFAIIGSVIVCFIHGFLWDEPIFRLLFLLSSVASLGIICYGGYCFGLLLIGARNMAQGQLDHQIPEKHLFGSFRDCARHLNSLSGAANTAVQSQLRSERMKTELITNVSHDIKTPLTSIINFVDLLEKPHSEEDEQQYLDVLSRQSLRLKKLIEDLMELSKANSGNIAVNLTALDAVEFTNQALGEFADKLENAQLIPVFRGPEKPLSILADGRLLWRVLSNLLGNTVKYAAPNTRVYIDLVRVDDSVQLSIRNISREELTVTAEELLERFVRGDVSRNTEGSGLGLNIAKSLTEVQHGKLELILDGDLFKVTLTFPAA